MCFNLAALFFNHSAQLALHGFESIVDHLFERLVCAVVLLSFVGDKLVAASHSHIDAAPIGISFLMRMICLLDSHVAAVDVVTEFFQSRCIIQNKVIDLV